MPGFAEAATFLDAYGNRAHLVSQTKPRGRLIVRSTGIVETIDKAGVIGRLECDPPPALFRRADRAHQARRRSCSTASPTAGGRIALLHELMARVHEVLGGAVADRSRDGEQEQSQGSDRPPTAARPRLHRRGPRARHPRPLRHRLSAATRAPPASTPGPKPGTRPGLDRLRPDAQPLPRRTATSGSPRGSTPSARCRSARCPAGPGCRTRRWRSSRGND